MNPNEPPFNFHFGQENAEELAKMNQWKWISPELFKSNNQYGLASIFKEYAGLPLEYPLRLTMEHAVLVGDAANVARQEIPEAILTPSEMRTPIIRKSHNTRPIPVGFAYLYAKVLFGKFGLPPIREDERKGTIVFPLKVIKTTVLNFDHAAYAAELKALPEKFQPVHVCIFYSEIPKIAQIYRDAGIPVVSAGHREDQLFLYRFHDLCRRFRYAASNEIGTNLFLSVSSGCRFFYLGGSGLDYEESSLTPSDNRIGDTFEKNRAEFLRLFREPVEKITPEQQAYVDAFIGVNCFVSPRKLRKILLSEHRQFEKLSWWHREKQLFALPDARNFSWKTFPSNRGWDGLRKDGDILFRWMGPTKEIWVDLHCPQKLQKNKANLSCQIHAITCEDLKISVNGKKIPNLKRINNENGFSLNGTVSSNMLVNPTAKNTIRIGFLPSGDEIPSDLPKAPPHSAAISHISLRPEN